RAWRLTELGSRGGAMHWEHEDASWMESRWRALRCCVSGWCWFLQKRGSAMSEIFDPLSRPVMAAGAFHPVAGLGSRGAVGTLVRRLAGMAGGDAGPVPGSRGRRP